MSLTRSAVVSTVVLSLAAAGSLSPAHAQAPTRNIYSFSQGHISPSYRVSSDLTADAAGNLYGTTPTGGVGCGIGCGTVYRLVPPAAVGQPWTEQTLANLTQAVSGDTPSGKLAIDPAGNLYGTSYLAGELGGGAVWELRPPTSPGNPWSLTVLHDFSYPSDSGSNAGGAYPATGVVMDSAGTLYGIAGRGGSTGYGVVFSLTPPASGGTTWTETVLHTFTGKRDTRIPTEPLTVSGDGRTLTGPASEWYNGSGVFDGDGAIYRLRRDANTWTYHLLYKLRSGHLGRLPNGPLVIDGNGNIFGTTAAGGTTSVPEVGAGKVFEVSPPAAGQTDWTGKVLHAFSNDGSDGYRPRAGLIAGKSGGTLFGTTSEGGAGGAIDGSNGNAGVVFRLDPPALGGSAWSYTALHAFGVATQSTGTAGDIQNGLTFGKNDFLFGITSQASADDRRGTVFAQSPR